jgi:hypothetical protein
MTELQKLIVNTARGYVGTPYGHQGRTKGIVVDCAGVPVGVALELGFDVEDILNYSREPNPAKMQSYLDLNLKRVFKKDMEPGDVVWIRFNKLPQHLAIVGNYEHSGLSLIHASNLVGSGLVVEHRLDITWLNKIVAAWRYEG